MSEIEDITKSEEINTNDIKTDDNKNGDGEKKVNVGVEIIKFIIYILVIFAITFFILHFLGQRTRVSGSSMEATLSDGDNLIVDKLTYRFSDPERFDIVVFPHEEPGEKSSIFNKTYYIKRIIGLPGETVYIDPNGNIFINGEKLEENYGLQRIANAGEAAKPFKLGSDEYFVMGDNRNNSSDSRFINVGPISRDELTGRAWVRIYPFNEICSLTDK